MCNVVFALLVDGRNSEQRDELLEELNAPLDPTVIANARRLAFELSH